MTIHLDTATILFILVFLWALTKLTTRVLLALYFLFYTRGTFLRGLFALQYEVIILEAFNSLSRVSSTLV